MNRETLEAFVDADEAAKFLSLTRRRVLDLARAGRLPGHPIGDGVRRVWRFRLSEIAAAVVVKPPVVFTSKGTHSNKLVKTVPGATE
jgi:excisionase family DNA binding protein